MTEEELRAALQEARDRADRLDFLLGAADLDIKGWFDRAEQHARRAANAEVALREATAEVERLRVMAREYREAVWAYVEEHDCGREVCETKNALYQPAARPEETADGR